MSRITPPLKCLQASRRFNVRVQLCVRIWLSFGLPGSGIAWKRRSMEKPCQVSLLYPRVPLLELRLVGRNSWKSGTAHTNFGKDLQFIGRNPQRALLEKQSSFLSWRRLELMDDLHNPRASMGTQFSAISTTRTAFSNLPLWGEPEGLTFEWDMCIS